MEMGAEYSKVHVQESPQETNRMQEICAVDFGFFSLCVVAPVLVSQLMMDGEKKKSSKSHKRERGQIWVSKF